MPTHNNTTLPSTPSPHAQHLDVLSVVKTEEKNGGVCVQQQQQHVSLSHQTAMNMLDVTRTSASVLVPAKQTRADLLKCGYELKVP